mgnify:CR=1 FL=1
MHNILYTGAFQKLRAHLTKSGKLPLPDLVEIVRDELDLSMMLSLRDRERIPAQGRLLIVANHPLAFLDLVALYTVVSDIRKDVVAVVETLSEFAATDSHVILAQKALSARRFGRLTVRSRPKRLSSSFRQKAVTGV